MMQRFLLTLIFLTIFLTSFSQTVKQRYDSTFHVLTKMLEGKTKPDFKRAVFMVENSFLDGKMGYQKFCKAIDYYEMLCRRLIESRDLQYSESDKEKVSVHAAVFTIMKDTLPIQLHNGEIIHHLPFGYDFNDINGEEDWTKMFVSKLLTTNKGNCHSLPYLYKIIAEELGEKAYLAFAPNHVYIKLHSKAFGWYNTELTSGLFPIDSWLMASGYIHLNSVQNGVYMDTLSQKQSIAACMIDLANGYKRKFGTGNGEFILKSCHKALNHYPDYLNAMLLKAETELELWKADTSEPKDQKRKDFLEIQKLYTKIHQLGYRKMPEEMYLDWLVSLKEERYKYQNKNININFE